MRSIRKYNNNIILAENNGQEVIVLGKGIGYKAIPGFEVDTDIIEKVFIPQESAHINRFADTLSGLAYEYLILASKIVDFGKKSLQRKLNPSVLVALADHLSVVFSRLDQNIDIQSPLQWELRHIYPEEFKTGMAALEIIKQERNIQFPESEAVFIALHFVNAEFEPSDMPETFKIVGAIGGVMRIVEQSCNIVLDENAIELMSFTNCVRTIVFEHIAAPSPLKKQKEDDELYALTMNRQKKVAESCARIDAFLRDKYSINLSKNDLSLLAIHILKIAEILGKNEEK